MFLGQQQHLLVEQTPVLCLFTYRDYSNDGRNEGLMAWVYAQDSENADAILYGTYLKDCFRFGNELTDEELIAVGLDPNKKDLSESDLRKGYQEAIEQSNYSEAVSYLEFLANKEGCVDWN